MVQLKYLSVAALLAAFGVAGVGCSSQPSHAREDYYDDRLSAADVRADDTPWVYSHARTYEENLNIMSRVTDQRLRPDFGRLHEYFLSGSQYQADTGTLYLAAASVMACWPRAEEEDLIQVFLFILFRQILGMTDKSEVRACACVL